MRKTELESAACDPFFTNAYPGIRRRTALILSGTRNLCRAQQSGAADACGLPVHSFPSGFGMLPPVHLSFVTVQVITVQNVLIMQVLVIFLAFILPLDCLGFSWPRQTKETMVGEVPESISNLGGLGLFFSLHVTLIDVVKTVCSITEN